MQYELHGRHNSYLFSLFCSWRLSCLFNEKLAGSGYLAEQKKSPQITQPVWTNKLCTTSLRGKDSIFYANRLVTSMYWVVKWATLRKKAQAYTHWPTGCPKRARMKDPSLHEPSKKVLQMKTWACQACFPRWKPTEGPKHNKPTHHQSNAQVLYWAGPRWLRAHFWLDSLCSHIDKISPGGIVICIN